MYPMPKIDDFFDQLLGASSFFKIDLRSDYHQLRFKKCYMPNISFKTRYGHLEFLIMSFGLTNSPVTFRGFMNMIFKQYLDLLVIVFIDGTFVYSCSENDHENHLRAVLQTLRAHHLFSKFSNCQFFLRSEAFFGHFIFGNAI